jgi:hypothetical protein
MLIGGAPGVRCVLQPIGCCCFCVASVVHTAALTTPQSEFMKSTTITTQLVACSATQLCERATRGHSSSLVSLHRCLTWGAAMVASS